MLSLTHFFILFIGGALGLKAAVISGIHPLIGIAVGTALGFALIRLRKSSEK